MATEQQFWERVAIGEPDECWLWTRNILKTGYGQVVFQGRHLSTHRVAYELAVGPIPEGMWVLHRCDVRACCNPAHLFLGSPLDNIEDMIAKGRDRQWNSEKDRCPQGHLYDEANTRVNRQGSRVCRACEKARFAAGTPKRQRYNERRAQRRRSTS